MIAINSFINDNFSVFEIRHYLTADAKDPFQQWYLRLRDLRSRIAVDRRVNRMEVGHFGDHKHLADGVWELRIDFGPGFRVYYGIEGNQIILLLLGGDKGSQQKDIEKASVYWRDWQSRGE